jgi:hypothetical protein
MLNFSWALRKLQLQLGLLQEKLESPLSSAEPVRCTPDFIRTGYFPAMAPVLAVHPHLWAGLNQPLRGRETQPAIAPVVCWCLPR